MVDNLEGSTSLKAQYNVSESISGGKTDIEGELSCFKDITKLTGYQLRNNREPWWACNKYHIEDENGKSCLRLDEEEAQPAIVRALCSSNRPFFISVVDRSTKDKILELERLMRCCSPIFCPWSRSTIIVRDKRGQILGYVKHAARETCLSWFGPSIYYEVADSQGNLKFLIQGPGGWVVECTKPNTFTVMTPDLSKQVGEIFHEWRGCCGGSFSFCLYPKVDHFTLRVNQELSVTNKALLLGTLLLAVLGSYHGNDGMKCGKHAHQWLQSND